MEFFSRGRLKQNWCGRPRKNPKGLHIIALVLSLNSLRFLFHLLVWSSINDSVLILSVSLSRPRCRLMTVGTRDASPHNYMVLFPEDGGWRWDNLHGRCVEKGKSELIGRMSTVCMCKPPWDVILVLFVRQSKCKWCWRLLPDGISSFNMLPTYFSWR